MTMQKSGNDTRSNENCFRLAMQELQALYFQRGFTTADEFTEQLKAIVAKFDAGVQQLRRQRFSTHVLRWGWLSLGGIVSIAAAARPNLAVSGAIVNLVLQALQPPPGGGFHATYVAKAQAVLVDLERDLRWRRGWLGRVFSAV